VKTPCQFGARAESSGSAARLCHAIRFNSDWVLNPVSRYLEGFAVRDLRRNSPWFGLPHQTRGVAMPYGFNKEEPLSVADLY